MIFLSTEQVFNGNPELPNRNLPCGIKDKEKYKDNPRDARLDTSLIQSKGIYFSDTPEAVSRCIRENHLKIK